MDLNNIIKKVRYREAKPLDVEKEYSIMIPLIFEDRQWKLIYELRAFHMDRQPGEISFPGGAVEDGETFKQAAIRETIEELNIEEKNIELIGDLDFLVSNSGMRINAYLGIIRNIKFKEIYPNEDEVDHVFTVPLNFFLNKEPDVYKLSLKRKTSEEFPYNLIPNGKEYKWNDRKDKIYFYYYKDYTIWGFTAKITKNFIDIIKK